VLVATAGLDGYYKAVNVKGVLDERRLRARLGIFEEATGCARHSWRMAAGELRPDCAGRGAFVPCRPVHWTKPRQGWHPPRVLVSLDPPRVATSRLGASSSRLGIPARDAAAEGTMTDTGTTGGARAPAGVVDGFLVRKDFVRRFKGQYPVPTYVAEFLLGRCCASVDDQEINEGLRASVRTRS
jgi:hypothetical protein